MSSKLFEALAVTAELCGSTKLSEAGAQAMFDELKGYPEQDVLAALQRCRRELTGALSLAAVIQRIPNGHPGPEEAWAMVSGALNDETVTMIITDQMRAAYFICADLAEDKIAARMAFLEAYRRELAVNQAPPKWDVILGWDVQGRETALVEAVRVGRITAQRALPLIDGKCTESSRVLLPEAAEAVLSPALARPSSAALSTLTSTPR